MHSWFTKTPPKPSAAVFIATLMDQEKGQNHRQLYDPSGGSSGYSEMYYGTQWNGALACPLTDDRLR